MPTKIHSPPCLTLTVVFAALFSAGCGQEFQAKDNSHFINLRPSDVPYQQNHQYPNDQRDPRSVIDLPQMKSSKPGSTSLTQSAEEEALQPSLEQSSPELDQTPDQDQGETTDTNSTTRAPIARPTPKPNPWKDSQDDVSNRSNESNPGPQTQPQSRPQLRPQPRPQSISDKEVTEKRDDRDSGSDKAPAQVVRPRVRPDDLMKNKTARQGVQQGVQQPARSSLPVHVKGLWEEAHSSGRRWTQITAEAMETYGKQLLATTPADIKSFCPNFSNLDRDGRMSFWVNLLSAIAIRESRLRPGTSYTEQFKDSSGTKVVSRGLLQISHESAKNYKCPVQSAKDLHDEEINLICGVKILNKWIPSDKRIQGSAGRTHLGAGRYWSVMRKGDSLNWIQSQMLQLDFCSDRK